VNADPTAQASSSDPVTLDLEDGVATLTLRGPSMNAFSTAMSDALIRTVRDLGDLPDVHACVVRGGDDNFAAGADIDELAAMSYETVVDWNARLHRVFDDVARLPFPVLAAVNGYALGGGLELALAADIRVAATDCVVGLPEITLGILPGSGGTQRLTQIVGRSTAKLLIMTGRHVHADEAQRLGILDQLCEPDGVLETAVDLARRIAQAPRHAIRAIKESVDAAKPVDPRGLALERAHLAGMFATQDRDELMGAFLDRRLKRRSGPAKALGDTSDDAG
jgi:enoyl-CoA hydratase/carnithine racemase